MNDVDDLREELPNLQRAVADFVARHGIEAPVQARLLDLTSEVGELAKEVIEATNYGRERLEPLPDSWGDVLFSLVCLANSTDVIVEAENVLRNAESCKFNAEGTQ
ncbi:hypothetical protein BH23ACT11_BH23ACT11_27680 [soil metagenome]